MANLAASSAASSAGGRTLLPPELYGPRVGILPRSRAKIYQAGRFLRAVGGCRGCPAGCRGWVSLPGAVGVLPGAVGVLSWVVGGWAVGVPVVGRGRSWAGVGPWAVGVLSWAVGGRGRSKKK